MNSLALLLFTMFYQPAPAVPFYTPQAVIQAAPAPQAPATYPLNLVPEKRPQAEPTVPTYIYTCPDGGWPIGDGQCHINNDRPGDVVK